MGTRMAKITGVGGVFFKSKGDSAALAAWYREHLGMALEDFGGAILKWPDDKAEDRGLTGCEFCHSDLGTIPIAATGKTESHIDTVEPCDTCHTSTAWSTVSMNHELSMGTCTSCHNGTQAEGKNQTHIRSGSLCEACHTTSQWSAISAVDHDLVIWYLLQLP